MLQFVALLLLIPLLVPQCPESKAMISLCLFVDYDCSCFCYSCASGYASTCEVDVFWWSTPIFTNSLSFHVLDSINRRLSPIHLWIVVRRNSFFYSLFVCFTQVNCDLSMESEGVNTLWSAVNETWLCLRLHVNLLTHNTDTNTAWWRQIKRHDVRRFSCTDGCRSCLCIQHSLPYMNRAPISLMTSLKPIETFT